MSESSQDEDSSEDVSSSSISSSSPTDSEEAKESSNDESSTEEESSEVNPKKQRKSYRDHVGLHGYRDLLNSSIEDVNSPTPLDDSGPLAASQIGASFWTSTEKDAFFSALATHGPGDLPGLAQAIGTKSIPETHVYVQLLQDGVVEANATLYGRNGFSYENTPAAHEISEDCETGLDDLGDTLRGLVDRYDVQAEKERFGDDWLIDGAVASKLDDQFESAEADNDESDDEDVRDKQSFFKHRSETSDKEGTFPSARLLRPESFLRLSENIFMNGPLDTDSNWRDLVSDDTPSDGPALFHTAFDDFYNLSISLTRRLVQATLFQTMSRLRAGESSRLNWQPQAVVTPPDVKTALDILGMERNSKKYWARAARRSRLDVYTDTAKYRDGRPGTKNGVKLSFDEVEAELGLLNEGEGVVGEEMNEVSDAESDVLTSESREDDVDESDDGPKDSESDTSDKPGQRRRALSPESFAQADDAYLEALDSKASREAEKDLWKLLRKDPPVQAEHDDDHTKHLEQPPRPLKREADDGVVNWRRRVRHRAEWEVSSLPVQEIEFQNMTDVGQRKRRLRVEKRERLKIQKSRPEPQQDVDESTASESDTTDDDESSESSD